MLHSGAFHRGLGHGYVKDLVRISMTCCTLGSAAGLSKYSSNYKQGERSIWIVAPQRGAEVAQGEPKMPQAGSEEAPRRPQGGPNEAPRRPHRGLCVYVCIYAYLRVCICVCIYIYIYVCMYICIYTYICIYIYICIHIHRHICICMCICIHVRHICILTSIVPIRNDWPHYVLHLMAASITLDLYDMWCPRITYCHVLRINLDALRKFIIAGI